jgi:hypothetical protein
MGDLNLISNVTIYILQYVKVIVFINYSKMFMNEICNLCNDAHKDNLDDIFKTRSYGRLLLLRHRKQTVFNFGFPSTVQISPFPNTSYIFIHFTCSFQQPRHTITLDTFLVAIIY